MGFTDKLLYKFLKIERTYSQTGEDKILKHLFNCYNKSKISYLDIGTNYPVIHNNTYLFYRMGGSGVCVEPNPEFAEMIGKVRSRDKCLNVGLGTIDGEVGDFYCMTAHTLNTFSKEVAEALNAEGKYKIKDVKKIPLRNINSIIKENFDAAIDLVSIDVEGWNEKIVESFDFSQIRPFCFCVETTTFSETNNEEKLTEIFDVFGKNDYRVYADTHINTIFLDNKI